VGIKASLEDRMAEKGRNLENIRKEGRKERAMSESSPLEMWMKRKRDREGERESGEEEKIFRSSKKVQRSPREKEGKGEQGREEKDTVGGKGEEVGKVRKEGEMWEILEETRKNLAEYVEKVKGMEKEMEEWRKREKGLKMEGEEMKRRIRELERKLEEKEIRGKEKEKEKGGQNKEENMEERIKMIEKNIEGKEREERRKRNFIMKGVQKEKGDWKWGVEKILKEIGAEVKVESMRRMNVGREERGEMVWVRVEKEEDKKTIWEKKRNLKGKKVWIEEDLTWKEREIRRRLGVMAVEERKKGKYAWVEGDRIKIEGEWWRWDEERKGLERVKQLGRMMGEGKGGSGERGKK